MAGCCSHNHAPGAACKANVAEDALMRIADIVGEVNDREARRDLLRLLSDYLETEEITIEETQPHRQTIEKIREYVREMVPIGGETEDEKITLPDTGDFEGIDEKNSMHVDCFLYDETKMDELVDAGELSRHYCDDCGSKNTRELVLHSHSLPVDAMDFMFETLLPAKECAGKALLDVGSRTGILLYYAYLHRKGNLASITGVELSEKFCEVQKQTVKKFGMAGAVEIVEGDVFKAPALTHLQTADILIFNNVFQFFAEPAAQKEAWANVRRHVKSGATLITVPSLESSFEQLGMELDSTWVRPVTIDHPLYAGEEARMIFKYKVL